MNSKFLSLSFIWEINSLIFLYRGQGLKWQKFQNINSTAKNSVGDLLVHIYSKNPLLRYNRYSVM
jgi:hypothetical protein